MITLEVRSETIRAPNVPEDAEPRARFLLQVALDRLEWLRARDGSRRVPSIITFLIEGGANTF